MSQKETEKEKPADVKSSGNYDKVRAGVESEKLQAEGYTVTEIYKDPVDGLKYHKLVKKSK